MSRCLMSWRINFCLERSDTDAANGFEELLALFTLGDIHIENAFDGFSDIGMRDRRTDHLTDRRIATVTRTAERDLVPLLATLIDAENADVTDRVMAAAVHATRHLQLNVA